MLFNIVASFSPIHVYKSPFNCNKKESINHLGKNYALSGSEAQTMVLDLLNTNVHQQKRSAWFYKFQLHFIFLYSFLNDRFSFISYLMAQALPT